METVLGVSWLDWLCFAIVYLLMHRRFGEVFVHVGRRWCKNTDVWSFCVQKGGAEMCARFWCTPTLLHGRFPLLRKQITRWEFHWINLQDLSHFPWWQQIMLGCQYPDCVVTQLWKRINIFHFIPKWAFSLILRSHNMTATYLMSRKISCPRL